jgi:hypothetical protein
MTVQPSEPLQNDPDRVVGSLIADAVGEFVTDRPGGAFDPRIFRGPATPAEPGPPTPAEPGPPTPADHGPPTPADHGPASPGGEAEPPMNDERMSGPGEEIDKTR